MADVKITALPAAAGANLTDLLAKVNDPSGVPVTQKLTIQQLKDLLKPYAVYIATLTQGGAAVPPTVTVLENTLGGVPVWSYIGTGNYRMTLAGAFPNVDKVFMLVGNIDASQPSGAMFFQWVSANAVDLFTYNDTTPPPLIADGCLGSNSIEIRVYP